MKSAGYSSKITTSLFHIKITVSVKKSLHQHGEPCYLHLPIFSYTYTLPFFWKINLMGEA